VFVTGNRVYIGDSENHRIRLLEVQGSSGESQ
jgi:hypothetical protein